MRVDLEKLKTGAKICANRQCPNFDPKAIKYLYPSSVYCSIKCKYSDDEYNLHNETYGD